MSRRFGRPRTREIALAVGLLILVLLRLLGDWSREPPPEQMQSGEYTVRRVVDGDTIILDNGAVVRLIGVDTPETFKPEHEVEPWGPEASDFTKDFLAGGKARLEFDRERLDRFGRFLAYVWVGDRLLNEELVRAGLARYEPHFHYAEEKKRRYRRAQEEARAARRGIWSDEFGRSAA